MDALYFLLLLVSVALIAATYWRLARSGRPIITPPKKFAMETAEEIHPFVKETTPIHRPTPELPNEYNETRAVLMVRDPDWLYAYWEIGADHMACLRQDYGDELASPSNMVLRVFEISDGMGYFDINVGNRAGNWHININKPGTPFYCLVGLKDHDRFLPLAVSNIITTPRNSMSDVFDDEWMLVNGHEQKLLKRIGSVPLNVTSPMAWEQEVSVSSRSNW